MVRPKWVDENRLVPGCGGWSYHTSTIEWFHSAPNRFKPTAVPFPYLRTNQRLNVSCPSA